jgi:branched-chain amino acid transport system substrate-binding protein
MRNRRLVRAAAVFAGLALVLAACGDDDTEDSTDTTQATAGSTDDTSGSDETTTTAAPAEPVDISESCDNGAEDSSLTGSSEGTLRIGYLLPQSGQLDFLGAPMICAVNMAVQEINAAGGINGQLIELVPADDGTDADVASTAADTLLASGVDFIVGAAASGVSAAVLDKITSEGVSMCSPSNTGVQFTTIDDNGGFYFRTAPPDNLQSQVLADLITADGFSNIAIVARSDEYGEGFAQFLGQELTNAGATVADTILYDPDAGTYSDVGEQLAAADPDAVALIAFEEGGSVIQGAIASSVGPQDLQWYGTDGIQSGSFFEAVDADDPGQVAGIRGTAPSAAPADGESTFRDRFSAFAPDVDTIFSGHAYDCVVIAALAAAVAQSDDPADIQAEVNGVTGGGTKCTLVAECLAAIAAGTDIDYDGAAGPLDFVDAGEPGAGSYDTWTFADDGSVEVIDTSIPVGAG